MAKAAKYYIVSAQALPDIFIQVAEAKRMLQSGEVRTAGDAAKAVGISRSAFYAMLKNNPGVLSNALSIFAVSGANILTINQSIPTNGCAAVTISAETSEMEVSLEELMARAVSLDGVVKFEILAG